MQNTLSILLTLSLCVGITSGSMITFLCLACPRVFDVEKKKLIITNIVSLITSFVLLLLYNFVY